MNKLQPFLSRISVVSFLALLALLLLVDPSQAQVYRIPGAREPEKKAAAAPQKETPKKSASKSGKGKTNKKSTKEQSAQKSTSQTGKQTAKANNLTNKTSSKKLQEKESATQESSTQESKWVQKESGKENGYAYVDLGLSVKWATCNIGATSPEGDGDCFAWGETKPKESYTEDNSFVNGRIIGDIGGRKCYDAANANWGGMWRLPTANELKELKEQCHWSWTDVNGVEGYVVKSLVNENSIFIPCRYNKTYWSSSAYSLSDAYSLSCKYGIHYDHNPKSCGCFVRPVLDEVLGVVKTQKWVQNESGKENGYAYVDLGLSVKWATCNIGATAPEDYGDYFAWGETNHKDIYTEKNSATLRKTFGDFAGNRRYDAAQVNWHGLWRMPTKAEQDELKEKCNWRKAKINGVTGYVVTSKVNGNSIFLPAAGYCYGTSLNHYDGNCYYWSSTPKEDHTDYAYNFFLTDSVAYIDDSNRERGMTIRPVAGKSSDIQAIKGAEDGHEWVDLGLSVKWATCNVGSATPEGYGQYFTQKKASSNSVLGEVWRLPTTEELNELKENCTWEWSVVNGVNVVNGYKVSSKVNGNSIFLPAAGYMGGYSLFHEGVDGYYWSSHKRTSLRFYNGYSECIERDKSYHMSVRPVISKNKPQTLENKWIQKESGKENGYAYVDLGLSVKWATCNIGATSPGGDGDYFAWGETKPKKSYIEDNSVTYGKEFEDIGGNPAYDAARANWGGSWRLPTKEEQDELISKCVWTYDYDADGFIVKSKVNGNSIFLPAAGYMDGSSQRVYDSGYWSSTPSNCIYFDYDIHYDRIIRNRKDKRYYGRSVRPVHNIVDVVDKTSRELEPQKEDEIYEVVEQPARYPGGEAALMADIGKNIRYPAMAAENDFQGRVVVQFVVEKNGSVGQVKVVRGNDLDLEKEAQRVCKTLKKFIPSRNSGVVVRSWYTLPINFKLPSN